MRRRRELLKAAAAVALAAVGAWGVRADPEAVRAALARVPCAEVYPPTEAAQAKLFNYTTPLEKQMGELKLLGRIPHKHSAEVSESPLGIGFETLDRDTFDPKKTFPFLAESGVKRARCQTGWMKCEKTVGMFDFAWLDEVVDGLAKIGIETWLSVSFGHPHYTPCKKYADQWDAAKASGKTVPGWARGWVGETPWYHGEEAMKGWRNYCKALARHFKGRVRTWEVWNEPEWFWTHGGKAVGDEYGYARCAKDYAGFLRFTAKAIREEIPDAQISFNLAMPSSGWIHALAREGIGDCVDIYNYHHYESTPEAHLREMIEQARACFVRPDGRPVRIWQGESGRATGKSMLFALPSQYAQAKFVARRVLADLHEGAEVSSVFTVTDFLCYYPDGRDQYYGLIDARADKPKLGFVTLQHLGWFCDGIRRSPCDYVSFSPCWGHEFRAMKDFSSVTVASFRRKGVPVFAWWQREHVEMTAPALFGTLRVNVAEGAEALRNPVLVDPVKGLVWDASAYRQFEESSGNVKFYGFYALDYPLLLTDLSAFDELVK